MPPTVIPLPRLLLPPDLAPVTVLGVDPGATTGIAVVEVYGGGAMLHLATQLRIGTDSAIRDVDRLAGLAFDAVSALVLPRHYAAEGMQPVPGRRAQTHSVLRVARVEGLMLGALSRQIVFSREVLYKAQQWRASIRAVAMSTKEAHRWVLDWAERTWGLTLRVGEVHTAEALAIAYHHLRVLARETRVATLPAQVGLALDAAKARRPTADDEVAQAWATPEHKRPRLRPGRW